MGAFNVVPPPSAPAEVNSEAAHQRRMLTLFCERALH
jgi:hypothetical protein